MFLLLSIRLAHFLAQKPLTPQTELTLSAKMKELPVMVWDSESGSMVEVPWDEGNVSAALRHRINSKISVKVRSCSAIASLFHSS